MHPATSQDELKHAIEPVYRLYSGLSAEMDAETGLGGKLLYAGELDEDGCRLVRAANIAGAASLSATADAGAQRMAIRDGVTDFLVTSLDEALRILKNEIRKRNPVAVGVGIAPARVLAEMRERGVLPDLLRAGAPAEDVAEFVGLGARVVSLGELSDGVELRVFPDVLADFEARAMALIPEGDHAARRWLRLSPRYLGPQMRRARSLTCDSRIAALLTTENGQL